jgi:hypothetical protein
MGTQLVELQEIGNRILRVESIPKMLKNHARRSPYGKMGHVEEN